MQDDQCLIVGKEGGGDNTQVEVDSRSCQWEVNRDWTDSGVESLHLDLSYYSIFNALTSYACLMKGIRMTDERDVSIDLDFMVPGHPFKDHVRLWNNFTLAQINYNTCGCLRL